MSLSNCETTMQVVPAYGYGNNGGMGWGGDWASWIILFLIFGAFGRGGFGGNEGGYFGYGYGSPFVANEVQRGFNNQAVVTKLDGITQGISTATYDLNNSIMAGFHGVDNAICNLGYNTQQGFNTTNIALMQGQNAISREIADCCCETKGAIKDVSYNLATQACDIKGVIRDTTRDILENANANSKAILDFLTQSKIESLRDENQSLRLAASQSEQNAVLRAAMDANTAEIIRRTGNDCPTAAYVVPNPHCCYGTPYGVLNGFNGCGSGYGAGCGSCNC